jgi:hypothetical protein
MATHRVEVTSADIARLAGVKPTAVSNWRRRRDDFPRPVGGTDRSPRFDLDQVEAWLKRRGRSADIPTDQRLWQELEAVRGIVTLEDALITVGALLLHVRQRPEALVPATPAELAGLVAHAEPTYASEAASITDRVLGLRRPEAVRLSALLRSVKDAARDKILPGGAAEVFESLCRRFLDMTVRAGAASTSPDLADLMVRLAGTPSGALLDPACGSGTILLAATANGHSPVLGQDVNPAMVRLAALRLAFHDAGGKANAFDVRFGDSLRQSASHGNRLAAVVSHPPFADRNWGHDDLANAATWEYGTPARTESELAWVQRALDRVVPGGTVVMLMPPAVAARPSGRRIRRELLTKGALRAVISLPPGLAAHHTLALQIWILRRPDDRLALPKLLVVNAFEGDGTRSWNRVHETAVEWWEKFCADPDGFAGRPGVARAVPVANLLDEQVDVTPRRHLVPPAQLGLSKQELTITRERFARLLATVSDAVPPGPLPDIAQPQVRATAITELVETGAVFIRRVRAQGVSDSSSHPIEGRILTGADLATGSLASRREEVDGDDVRNPPIRLGDVLVPVAARRLTARVADSEDAGAYPASTVYVVRVDPEVIDPWFLAGYLSSSEGARQAERVGSSLGGEIRVDLRRARVPLLPIGTQRAYGRAFQRLSEFSRTLRAANDLGLELARTTTDAITAGLLLAAEGNRSAP